jgi:hypothetical protein
LQNLPYKIRTENGVQKIYIRHPNVRYFRSCGGIHGFIENEIMNITSNRRPWFIPNGNITFREIPLN